MNIRTIVLAASLATAGLAGPAIAQELAPARGHSIDLGTVNGVAYYTVENGGFRVVATLGQENGKPVRLEATLGPGQSVVLSTPTEPGTAPARVEITRDADDLQVHAVAVTN